MRYAILFSAILALAACESAPKSIIKHPGRHVLNIDDHKIYVVEQSNHVWLAAGGEKTQDGFVEYRQKRAVEVQSKCRVNKVLSKPGEPLLRVSVNQCRA